MYEKYSGLPDTTKSSSQQNGQRSARPASNAGNSSGRSVEYMQTIARYSGDGYSLYARHPGSIKGSMPHQHTHLIKIDEKRKKWIFYIRRPHVRWMR